MVQETKTKRKFTLCEYKIELGKLYSQIVFCLCIDSEFEKTFDNNCETVSTAEFKNHAKSILSIFDNGNVNDDTDDFSLDYLNPTNSKIKSSH